MTTSTLSTKTYQGWANYETWNVALYIGNHYGLYNQARRSKTYQDLVNYLYKCGSTETPDGVKWTDTKIDGIAINKMMKDL